MSMQAAYPVEMGIDSPLEIDRWRVLQGILAIPHFIVVGILNFAAEVVTVIMLFTTVFTGNVPENMFAFRAFVMRYQWRVYAYALFMTDQYPAFEFSGPAADPGGYPATLSVTPPEGLSRWLWLFKGILAIPHFIALIVLGIGVYIVAAIAWLVVLVTGKWPEGMRNFVVGVIRWAMRIQAYVTFMTDVYPPFSLE